MTTEPLGQAVMYLANPLAVQVEFRDSLAALTLHEN